MAHCTVPGGKIYYSVQGRGPTVVLVRGYGRSNRYWTDLSRRLLKTYRLVHWDLRGLGRTSVPMQWQDAIDDLAKDGLDLLKHLQIKRFHLFGMGIGSQVAMSMAAQTPHGTLSLAVAGATSADYIGFRVSPVALQKLAFSLLTGQFQDCLLDLQTAPAILRSRKPEIESAWREVLEAENFPLPVLAKQIWASSRFRIAGRLDAQTLPVLILHGGVDRLVPQFNAMQLHRILPGSSFRTIKTAGHEIELGHEAELAAILQNFWRRAGES